MNEKTVKNSVTIVGFDYFDRRHSWSSKSTDSKNFAISFIAKFPATISFDFDMLQASQFFAEKSFCLISEFSGKKEFLHFGLIFDHFRRSLTNLWRFSEQCLPFFRKLRSIIAWQFLLTNQYFDLFLTIFSLFLVTIFPLYFVSFSTIIETFHDLASKTYFCLIFNRFSDFLFIIFDPFLI